MLLLRLLPYRTAPGAWNMAADDALLASAAKGVASLRFYGWSAATLSLGYFQPAAPARSYRGLGMLDWVRRPSGGAALVHHHEVTYALALPPGRDWQPPGRPWLHRFHELLAAALGQLGARPTLCQREEKRGDVLCFLHHTPGDLLIGESKVVGSAQRKVRGALLQHGGILLAQSIHTPELPGIEELTGRRLSADTIEPAVIEQVRAGTGWTVELGDWGPEEDHALREALHQRYTAATWNERR